MNYAGSFDATSAADGPQAQTVRLDAPPAHAPADAIVVSDAHLLFNADFKRSGVDLILSGQDHELVLHDYFKGEKRAALASPDGAHLTGDIVNALTAHVQYSQAGGGTAAGQVIGHVSKLSGTATATRNGVSIILNNGDNVEKGDVVQSGSDSILGITFVDGTVFGLSSNARMVLNEMIYDPNGSNNSSLISLVAGTISFVAGQTAKHGDMKIDTPVATMGIRGTAVLVQIDFLVAGQGDTPDAKFQVLVEPDGSTGSYILYDKTTLTPIATVDQAGQQINISHGVVSTSNEPLPPDVQKLINDVFSLKFTSNPQSFDHFTDIGIPSPLQTIRLANGGEFVPPNFLSKAVDGSTTQSNSPEFIVTIFVKTIDVTSVADNPHFALADQVKITDSNQSDTITPYVPGTAAILSVAAPPNLPAGVDLTKLLGLDPATGRVNYDPASFAFLGGNQKIVFTIGFSSQVGNEIFHEVLTITIDGVNFAPTIVTGTTTATGAVGEIAATTGSTATDAATGVIGFADPNLGDTHTVSHAAPLFVWTGGTLSSDQVAAITSASTLTLTETDSTGTGSGKVGWSYNAQDSTFDFLAAGQKLTITYAVTIADGQGGSVVQNVAITITGTDDTPVITGHTDGAVTEHATSPNLTSAGTVSFTDVDLTDTHTVTAKPVGTTLGTLSASLSTDTSNGVGGKVNWSYTVADSATAFLAAGQTKVEHFTVTVNDGHGGTTSQDISVTITGTNELPVITGHTDGAVTEDATHPDLTSFGTVSFTDADLTDTHKVSATPVGTTLGTLSASIATDTTGSGLGGQINWSYTVPESATDFLAAGQTKVEHFTVTVDDGHGGTASQDIAVTITGTNESPVITGHTDGAVTEHATSPNLTSAGTVSFTDVDLTDTHTVTAKPVGTTLGTLSASLSTDTSNGVNGKVNWSYTVADSATAFLAAGQTSVEHFTVTVGDGHGGTASQDISVTITGTNEAPTIVAGSTTAAGAIGELAATTGSTASDSASGSVAFADVDLIDKHTVSQAAPTFTWSGGTLNDTQFSALTSASKLTLTETDSTGTGSGSVAWNYSAQDKAFDFLAAGQTVMVTYAVTVEDGHGGNAVQNVVVTVTGTDDKPVITGHTDGAVTDNATQPNLTSAGTVSFTDVDLTDTHTASAKPVGTTLGTLIASISPDTSNGVGGKVNWSYTVADSAVNSLAAGQTKVEHFTVTVDDGHGGTASQDIAITITGANDAPTIVAGSTTATGAFTHSDDRGHDVATGRIAFADVDLSDTHTVSQAPPTFSLSKGTLTDSQKSILLGASSLALKETDSTGSGSGSVAWTYSLTDRGADLLKEGQQLTVTYAVTVKDNHGASTIQNVVVTVTGGDEHESDPAGVAGSATNLGLTQLADVSSREVTVTGSPLNWVMDGATHNADGSWIAQTSDFSALTITPDVNFVGATLLNVVETWTNPDGSAGSMVVSDNVEAYAPGSPIFAVAGDDHLTSNGTGNLLVFAQPIGNDIVYNFNGTLDKIDLIGFDNIASFADIQSGISNDANGNAVIKIGADETITVDGIHAASLTASDFVFNQTPVTQNSATMQIGDGAHLSLSGTINNTGTIELSSTGHETYLQLIEHAITLEGGGHVVLSDSVENSISGTSSDVTLTNVDNTISGAGQIGAGQLTLINEGTIDATGANALTVDTGVNVVTNSGTLEANGSGGLIVQSDVFNSGVLWANDGHVTVQGAVSGNGIAKIDGSGSLDFEASSTANVVFGSEAAGTLKLGDSFHFNGTISGFTGSDTIDLANVGSATASISYLENAAGTGGTLTVSDGLQSAELSFLGQYSADNFNVVSDHAKGTLITYVPHDLLV